VLEDEQSLINGYLTEIDVPGSGPERTVGNLVTLSETPGGPKGDPPELGEANAEVLRKAGLSEQEVNEITDHANDMREAAINALLGSGGLLGPK
jgi:crotonobetainyl-CoA:carnitine CoA-transferase CaiB-like acyl-CoA transferase